MQRLFLSIFVTLITFLTTYPAQAATFYRHVPFTISLKPDDSLVVDYDFSEKKGVTCLSNRPRVAIDFTYKGHAKSAFLPVILQSAKVPEKPEEELADINGQYSLSINKIDASHKAYEIKCSYIE